MAKQTPFNKIVRPSERESLLMEYAVKRKSAMDWRYRAACNMRSDWDSSYEIKFARQDAARCRQLWKEIQAL